MKRKLALALIAAGLALASVAGAADRPVSIAFADLGNIRDWRAEGHDTLLVKAAGGDWYRATFWSPCFQLGFAETIGFVTEPGGSLDKFSSIMVGGERCWFRTFERAAPPGK